MAGRHNVEDIELQLLLEAIYLQYGYDFRDYARASVKRRLSHRLVLSGLQSFSQLQHAVLRDRQLFEQITLDLSISVTEMFRDPSFYRALRQEVVPVLKTYPFVKIWHAGCASGEEVYSMAILLTEENLYNRCQIYATDFNELVLQQAREAIYPVEKMKQYSTNYLQAGGQSTLADYYTASYDLAIIHQELKKNILFAAHNLVTDGTFGEMHLIMCRNVLIYFNKELQTRVVKLFVDSLCRQGFLCLGSKESLRFSPYYDLFEEVIPHEKIYRKKI
ncbi:MAG: CheR family methyltransferase [Desulfurispora sp.]|uniref:CheR family methyltransferase n=1 Tax=Desulfurispora sp. TaxID=3014275 RepID=UPI00404A5AFA